MRALVLATLLAANPLAAQETVLWGESGNWQILVDPSQGNGCFAYVSYEDGSFFRAGYDMRDGSTYVFFSNPAWASLVPDNEYAIRMNFDPINSYWDADALAQAFDDGTLFLKFTSPEEALLDDIIKASQARVEYNGNEIASYDLTGSTRAMLAVIDCQKENASAAADPFANETAVSDPFAN